MTVGMWFDAEYGICQPWVLHVVYYVHQHRAVRCCAASPALPDIDTAAQGVVHVGCMRR